MVIRKSKLRWSCPVSYGRLLDTGTITVKICMLLRSTTKITLSNPWIAPVVCWSIKLIRIATGNYRSVPASLDWYIVMNCPVLCMACSVCAALRRMMLIFLWCRARSKTRSKMLFVYLTRFMQPLGWNIMPSFRPARKIQWVMLKPGKLQLMLWRAQWKILDLIMLSMKATELSMALRSTFIWQILSVVHGSAALFSWICCCQKNLIWPIPAKMVWSIVRLWSIVWFMVL